MRSSDQPAASADPTISSSSVRRSEAPRTIAANSSRSVSPIVSSASSPGCGSMRCATNSRSTRSGEAPVSSI